MSAPANERARLRSSKGEPGFIVRPVADLAQVFRDASDVREAAVNGLNAPMSPLFPRSILAALPILVVVAAAATAATLDSAQEADVVRDVFSRVLRLRPHEQSVPPPPPPRHMLELYRKYASGAASRRGADGNTVRSILPTPGTTPQIKDGVSPESTDYAEVSVYLGESPVPYYIQYYQILVVELLIWNFPPTLQIRVNTIAISLCKKNHFAVCSQCFPSRRFIRDYKICCGYAILPK